MTEIHLAYRLYPLSTYDIPLLVVPLGCLDLLQSVKHREEGINHG